MFQRFVNADLNWESKACDCFIFVTMCLQKFWILKMGCAVCTTVCKSGLTIVN